MASSAANSSRSSSPSNEDLDTLQIRLNLFLTENVPKLSSRSSDKKTTQKRTKKHERQKEAIVPMEEGNYVEFLRSLLKPFSKDKYPVSAEHPFVFKYGTGTR